MNTVGSICTPGRLHMSFRYDESSGEIQILLDVHGAMTVTTVYNEDGAVSEPEVLAAPDVTLRCWMNSTTTCFFREMFSWLEAVVSGVRECAFMWEGEGPEGEFRWHRNAEGNGMLEIKWSGGRGSVSFQHEFILERKQFVGAMYGAFIAFVESDSYDPILYERMTDGEAYDFIVTDGRLALAEELAKLDRSSAFKLISVVRRRVQDYEKGPHRGGGLATFKQIADSEPPIDLTDEVTRDHINFLLGRSWDEWDAEQRRAYVNEVVFSFQMHGVADERLRELRSRRIEEWLSEKPPAAGLVGG